MNDDLALLILGELRAIHATLRRQAAAEPLADRLERCVRAVVGTEPFVASRLIDLTQVELPARLELRAVLEDVARCSLDDAGATRRIGKFLAANSRFVQLGSTREGLVYRVGVETETRNGNTWAALLK
jgi:hypothetical protein